MSNELLFLELNKYIEEKGGAGSEDELKALVDEFMATHQTSLSESNAEKNAYDFLELAEAANSQKESLKYAKEALKLEPDNLDAKRMIVELSSDSFEQCLEKLKKLISEAEEQLKSDGFFVDENIGVFWLIVETRPYMRLLERYAYILAECGKMRLSTEVCEKMLRLCESDNMGARYRLMHLYSALEDDKSALELLKKYPHDESVQLLLPLSILYYKLGNMRESEKYLKKLRQINSGTNKFFDAIVNDRLDKCLANADLYAYSPNTIEEYLLEAKEAWFLFASSSAYFRWAWKKLKTYKK